MARIDPRLTYDAARNAILRGMERAGRLERTRNGRAYRTRIRPNADYPYAFRAVVGPGEGTMPAVITILRSGA